MSVVNQSKHSVYFNHVLNHRAFLKQIDKEGLDKYYNPAFVANAIRRYESYWIPLVLHLSKDFNDDLEYAPPIGKHQSIISIFDLTLVYVIL